jgi:hypothetical protein
LQHIFGVGRAAGNAMRSPENAVVVRLEENFEFSGGFFYKSQSLYGCQHSCLLKIAFHSYKRGSGGFINNLAAWEEFSGYLRQMRGFQPFLGR